MFHPISTPHQSTSRLLRSPQRNRTIQQQSGRFKTPISSKNADADADANLLAKSTCMGPKQLFSDLMKDRNSTQNQIQNQTPISKLDRKAFGDKTNSPSKNKIKNLGGGKVGGVVGVRGQGGEDKSPTKSSQPSTSSNPFKTPSTNSTRPKDGDRSRDLESHSARFVTPKSNIGKKGLLKVRMAELLDREMGIDSNLESDSNHVIHEEELELNEEELYPEIESFGNGDVARDPPYEFPSEFQGLPSAKELSRELKSARYIGRFNDSKEELEGELEFKSREFEIGALGGEGDDGKDFEGGKDLQLEILKRKDQSDDEWEQDEKDDLWPDLEIQQTETETETDQMDSKTKAKGNSDRIRKNQVPEIKRKVGVAPSLKSNHPSLVGRSKLQSDRNGKAHLPPPSSSNATRNPSSVNQGKSASEIKGGFRTTAAPSTSQPSKSIAKTSSNVAKSRPLTLNSKALSTTSKSSTQKASNHSTTKSSSNAPSQLTNLSKKSSSPSSAAASGVNGNRRPLSTLKVSNIQKPSQLPPSSSSSSSDNVHSKGIRTGNASQTKKASTKKIINPALRDENLQNDELSQWLKNNEKGHKIGVMEEEREILFDGF